MRLLTLTRLVMESAENSEAYLLYWASFPLMGPLVVASTMSCLG